MSMKGINLVINSTFKPITMDERLKPLLLYQLAYQELEDALAELEGQANVWERLADSTLDEDVYRQYRAYADSVRNQAASIARHGLTPGSRKAMVDLKARYKSDIDPIEKAWTERERQALLQQQAMITDPTRRFRYNANDIGLRKYMNGDLDALSDNFSGTLLASQAAAMSSQLKTALTKKGGLLKLGLPFQYEQLLLYGYTPELIDMAVLGLPGADPVLVHIIDSVMNANGINTWGNDALSREARLFIGLGMYSAIGETKINHFTDEFGMKDRLDANSHKRTAAAAKASQQNPLDIRLPGIKPINLYSQKERTLAKENIDRWGKYFALGKDGEMHLTPEGAKHYKYTINRTPAGLATPQYDDARNFKKFVDELNGGELKFTDDGRLLWTGEKNRNNLGRRYSSYVNEHTSELYDAHKETEFGYDFNVGSSTELSNIKNLIVTSTDGAALRGVDYDTKSRTFKSSGKQLSTKDLLSNDYKVTQVQMSHKGLTFKVVDKDGKVSRYELPKVHKDAYTNVTNNLYKANIVRDMLYAPNLSKVDITPLREVLPQDEYQYIQNRIQSGIPLSQYERASWAQIYAQLLSSAYTDNSQMWYINTTEPLKFSSYGDLLPGLEE